MSRPRFLACATVLLALGLPACGSPPAAQAPSEASTGLPPPTADKLATTPLPPAAQEQLGDAVRLIDEAQLEAAFTSLEKLHKAHPTDPLILHELALAYRLSDRPSQAVALLAPWRTQLTGPTVASLVSALDEAKRPAEALQVAGASLQRLPNSGLLYAAQGTTLEGVGRGVEAMNSYRLGMGRDGFEPANYLRAAILASGSNAPGWALVYGEVFLVLEPGSDRSQQLAKGLVKLLDEHVTVPPPVDGESGVEITLAPGNTPPPDKPMLVPFVNAFEMTYGVAVAKQKLEAPLSLASLAAARKEFLQLWFDGPGGWAAPVPLFVWHRELADAGHGEAYSYLLFSPAFPEEFQAWGKEHQAELQAFGAYLRAHPFPKEIGQFPP